MVIGKRTLARLVPCDRLIPLQTSCKRRNFEHEATANVEIAHSGEVALYR